MTNEAQLAAGTYEILRNRMRDAAEDLRDRLGNLNAARAEVFGNIETVLLSTERITTDHNCVPRDLHQDPQVRHGPSLMRRSLRPQLV